MRPQSRTPSKRRLQLPTITEETLRDRNQAYALHSPTTTSSSSSSSSSSTPGCALSCDDYRLSICHLAHPTFPMRETSSCSAPARQQGLHPQHPRPQHPGDGGVAATSDLPCWEEAGVAVRLQGETSKDSRAERLLPGYRGNSDPLEYLYGRRDNPAVPGRRRRSAGGGVSSEGQPGSWACGGGNSVVPSHSSGKSFPHQRPGTRCPLLAGAPASSPADPAHRHTAVGSKQAPKVKHSLVSQWISDCRSAWREARIRACILPAIAEI